MPDLTDAELDRIEARSAIRQPTATDFVTVLRRDTPALIAALRTARQQLADANQRIGELEAALCRTVAHEAELVNLLDPDNEQAVEILERQITAWFKVPYPHELARRILATLRDAANGEAGDE